MTIQTKLSVGDTAYFLENNKVEDRMVEEINTATEEQGIGKRVVTSITYLLTGGIRRHESSVFPTKADLLASL